MYILYLVKSFLVPNKKVKKLFIYLNNSLSFGAILDHNLGSSDFYGLFAGSTFLPVENIKVQEMTFLSEYFLITALFCLTLFALFSLKPVVDEKHFLIKFQYNNQLVFLLVFTLICYLSLVYQQINISVLTLTSFNDSIINDSLAIVSKFIIGISSICYLVFTTQYLKDQKLSNFEYYILILTSIFGFFLLCCTNDLITAYLAIELQGLAFYVLASFKKSSNFSIESGVKYFVLGSLSTALFLLGVTFVYGFSGSLILTDFNDFFIWVFSTNSFFLSFDSIFKALENFQHKTFVTESSSFANLQIMSDNLDLLKSKACLLGVDFEFSKSTFNDFSSKTNELSEIKLCSNISDKMSDIYYQMTSNSLLNYHDCTDLTNTNQLQANLTVAASDTFLIENSFQNASVVVLYGLENNQLDHTGFTNFKNDFLKANFYENIGSENFHLQDKSLGFLKLNDSFAGVQCFSSVHDLLKCCALSDEFSEAFVLVSDKLTTLSESSKAHLGFESKNLFDLQSYLFSTINVLSFDSFFLNSFDETLGEMSFMFDFSFVIFGMSIILLALFFKLALAPFHLWSPDVYEGSPSSSTFYFMVISKLSIFVFLLRLFYSSFYSLISYWQFYSILVATISIFIGAVGGLKQRKLKSLLTYSSINNMGFVLLAFSVGSFEGIQVKFYYLIVYIIASLCIWAVILNLKLKKKMYSEKQNRDLGDLALLQESNSVIAQTLAVTLFSMAGLPPMVGFLAKMGVFKALTGVSIYFFSIINILFSVIATFYYLRIVKIIFFENLLVGSLYASMSSKKVFLINFLNFLLVFFFVSPMFLYLYSYKITLFLNKAFY